MIQLLIAEDHAIMRAGLKQLFIHSDKINVVAEAVNGAETLQRLRHGGVDVLLLDMSMPGICGEDLITRIHAQHPALPILVLSMHNEIQIVQRALHAGAVGYLTKDQDAEVLLEAVTRVGAGHRYIDPLLAERMVFGFNQPCNTPRHQCLTERELQVLRLFSHGLAVNEIAIELAISHKTISTHKARLMEKMEFRNNADLIKYAIANELVI